MQVTTVGLDLAKRIFQVHGVDAAGKVVIRRRLQRSEIAAFFADLPACLVGIEACATAHYWAQEGEPIDPSIVETTSHRAFWFGSAFCAS